MISSLFVSNSSGVLFFEKHWRKALGKRVCDEFFKEFRQANTPLDIPPIIANGHYFLFSVFHSQLFFIAVVEADVQPLFIFEIIQRVIDLFSQYFGTLSEETIRENFLVAYELLEELLDNGFPLTTEANVLKELIHPPSYVRTAINIVTGGSNVSGVLPTGQLTNIPWRKVGVKYTTNEIYFDVIEEIDVILDSSGKTISCEISGEIQSLCHLSGMPDLVLTFANPALMEDLSFHPCVRFRRWENEKILSFVPPDGPFQLATYRVSTQSFLQIPVYVRPIFNFSSVEGTGKCQITVGSNLSRTEKVAEAVSVTIQFPRFVSGVTATVTLGSYMFDQNSKVFTWEIGKVSFPKVASLNGNIFLAPGASFPESNPGMDVSFTVNQHVISGIKVNRLDIFGERYKPYKGVKYVTKAGKFHIRS